MLNIDTVLDNTLHFHVTITFVPPSDSNTSQVRVSTAVHTVGLLQACLTNQETSRYTTEWEYRPVMPILKAKFSLASITHTEAACTRRPTLLVTYLTHNCLFLFRLQRGPIDTLPAGAEALASETGIFWMESWTRTRTRSEWRLTREGCVHNCWCWVYRYNRTGYNTALYSFSPSCI